MARPAQLAVAVILVALLVAAPAVNAVTCGQVSGMLSPCIRYAMGKDATTSPDCCKGVQNLNSAARTTADRQATCKCLKQRTSSMPGLNRDRVAGIPGKCGVHVPYAISPSTDCSQVR